jgi:hypothetical protein
VNSFFQDLTATFDNAIKVIAHAQCDFINRLVQFNDRQKQAHIGAAFHGKEAVLDSIQSQLVEARFQPLE